MTTFDDIARDAKTDDSILGLILVGSRGKGFENEHSDHDAILIAADGAAAKALHSKYESAPGIDLMIFTLPQFEAYAAWGTPMAWDRYNFAHVKLLADKTGKLPALIEAKGTIPPEHRTSFIDSRIDGYINGLYRSVKCVRAGNNLGAHLEAANAMLDLITLVFALNARHAPFFGYLEKELTQYPLEHLPLPAPLFTEKLHQVLATADLETQQDLARKTETLCRTLGHGKIFDSWNGKDRWSMTWKP